MTADSIISATNDSVLYYRTYTAYMYNNTPTVLVCMPQYATVSADTSQISYDWIGLSRV